MNEHLPRISNVAGVWRSRPQGSRGSPAEVVLIDRTNHHVF